MTVMTLFANIKNEENVLSVSMISNTDVDTDYIMMVMFMMTLEVLDDASDGDNHDDDGW